MSTLLRGCVGRSGVSKALKCLKETGSALSKVGSTPVRRVEAPKLIENAGEKVRRNSRRSVKKLALAASVSCGAMQNELRSDLSLSPCGKTEAQLLSWAARAKGLQRAGLLLKGFGDGMQPPVLWTDERLFTVWAVHSHQGNRVYAVNEQGVLLNGRLAFRGQRSGSAVVRVGVAMAGKRAPSFSLRRGWVKSAHVSGAVAERVGALNKCSIRGRRNYPPAGRSHIHMANLVQEWCKKNMAGFRPKELWPTFSPDLNPLDFAIWSILESKTCSSGHQGVGALGCGLGLVGMGFGRNRSCLVQSGSWQIEMYCGGGGRMYQKRTVDFISLIDFMFSSKLFFTFLLLMYFYFIKHLSTLGLITLYIKGRQACS